MNENEIKIEWLAKNTIRWAEGHFASLPLGGIWSPEGQGFLVMKSDEREFTLIQAVKHPAVIEALKGLHSLLFEIGYTYAELPDVKWDDPPNNDDEIEEITERHKEVVVQSWKFESGYPLKESDITDVYPIHQETQEILSEDGETQELEIWTYTLTSPSGEEVKVVPEDFMTMFGTERLHLCDTGGVRYRGLTRQEICDKIEAGYVSENFTVLGKEQHGVKIPPWMWGVVAIDVKLEQGEEE
tara:strand:+ start:1270 stop:1995 length:726 start_codon:yes stop_codon:yes gene_type:complete